jgi:hypothetical protein
VSAAENQPWERQDGESAPAFAAFCHYRDLGPKRSLLRAYQQHKPDAEQLAGIWSEWSAKWRWYDRALAYDDHLEALRLKQREKRMVELEARRIDFEIEQQENSEKWVEELDKELWAAINEGYTDVEEELIKDAESGELKPVKRKTKVKFPSLGSVARLLKERHESLRIAVEGPRTKDSPKPSSESTPSVAGGAAFVWVKPPPSTDEEPPTT